MIDGGGVLWCLGVAAAMVWLGLRLGRNHAAQEARQRLNPPTPRGPLHKNPWVRRMIAFWIYAG